jgi:hypothetical protein
MSGQVIPCATLRWEPLRQLPTDLAPFLQSPDWTCVLASQICICRTGAGTSPDRTADTVTTRRPSQGGPQVTIDPEEGRALGDEALTPPVHPARGQPRVSNGPGVDAHLQGREGTEEARNPRRARSSVLFTGGRWELVESFTPPRITGAGSRRGPKVEGGRAAVERRHAPVRSRPAGRTPTRSWRPRGRPASPGGGGSHSSSSRC